MKLDLLVTRDEKKKQENKAESQEKNKVLTIFVLFWGFYIFPISCFLVVVVSFANWNQARVCTLCSVDHVEGHNDNNVSESTACSRLLRPPFAVFFSLSLSW